jgi:hypothetical protein
MTYHEFLVQLVTLRKTISSENIYLNASVHVLGAIFISKQALLSATHLSARWGSTEQSVNKEQTMYVVQTPV